MEALLACYAAGGLGGEVMPEDANPHLPRGSAESYAYFTLPMALNYQRDSYALWKGANRTYADADTRKAFSPQSVQEMDLPTLQALLTAYKVALQPNRHPVIWKTLCDTFASCFAGDIRNLFSDCGYSVRQVQLLLAERKKQFPYLGGAKISNYWLYVLINYTDLALIDREAITVAPDTHVIQASVRLGLLAPEEAEGAAVQALVAERWKALLRGTDLQPIDLHTPLWLWSRGRFAGPVFS